MAKLTVHRSNIERQRRREVRSDMRKCVSDIASQHNVRAYAIVAITDEGMALAGWDTGGVVPMWAFAPTISAVLQAEMECSLDAEDIKVPLVKGRWSK